MRIALAQIGTGTDPAANLELVADHTARAADAGADLVLFPEATMCRFGVPLAPVAQPLDGPWANAVRDIAARSGVTVVAGMFCPATGDADSRVTNTLIATGPGLDAARAATASLRPAERPRALLHLDALPLRPTGKPDRRAAAALAQRLAEEGRAETR